MHYLIISTYTEHGSQNIGDKLMELCTKSAITYNDPDAIFDTLFRGADPEKIDDYLHSADVIVFACFSIRKNLESNYPILHKILNSGKPVAVLSAGSKVKLFSSIPFASDITDHDRKLIKQLAQQCIIFTTRDRLTHNFVKDIGISSAIFTGDIAFFGLDLDRQLFKNRTIENVYVSDPNKSHKHISQFERLVEGLRLRFPTAKICLMCHGNKSQDIADIAEASGMEIYNIFHYPESGLEIYNSCDLHIGFRVHGHVSALKRGQFSYLLEQDGRGCGYGLSLSPKISVPAYPPVYPKFNVRSSLSYLLRGARIMIYLHL